MTYVGMGNQGKLFLSGITLWLTRQQQYVSINQPPGQLSIINTDSRWTSVDYRTDAKSLLETLVLSILGKSLLCSCDWITGSRQQRGTYLELQRAWWGRSAGVLCFSAVQVCPANTLAGCLTHFLWGVPWYWGYSRWMDWEKRKWWANVSSVDRSHSG